ALLGPGQARAGAAAAGKGGAAGPDAPAPHRSRRHFFFARIEYPAEGPGAEGEVREGYLIYLKPTLTGDESAELQGYAALNPDFPTTPTLEQLYGEGRFEAHRQLGEHGGERLCEEVAGAGAAGGGMWAWGIGCADLLSYFERPETPQSDALERLR